MSLTRTAPRPTSIGGRWSLLPEVETDPARRATVTAGLLLDRYGVVTRGAVQSEGVPGGFAQAYRVLAGFEEAGHCRRGYVIEKLGAAQFAASATVDRLRTYAGLADPPPRKAVTLAATDPANPYGAALGWPKLEGVSHRPGRKAGGLVVLVDGALVLSLERGGRTVLCFTDDEEVLQAAAADLATTARDRRLDTLTVEKVNGEGVYGTILGRALQEAGFVQTPRGFTLRKAKGNDMAITTSEARRDLFGLIERVNLDHSEVEITSRRGSAVLMSKAEYDSLVETSYLLRSPANARRLLSALAAVHDGDVSEHDLDEA
ncbi:unnamed protein product [Penicillium discolor]